MIDLKKLPDSPGCYIYKDEKDRIIYIGKAKNLKKRVSSYFHNKDLDTKTRCLVENVSSYDFIATNTENEAFILENTLIKKHKPKYNIDLKDSKRYAYLEMTAERFPRLVLSRDKIDESGKIRKGKLFGPFTSGLEREYVHEIVIRTFKLRTCRKLPKKACLRFHINLCSAPCIGNITEKDYDDSVSSAVSVLEGKTEEIITRLKRDMKTHSDSLQYENAKNDLDRINSLEYLKEKQNVERNKRYDEDIIDYIVKEEKVYLLVFNLHKGTLVNKSEFAFAYNDDFFDEFIIQYYSDKDVPKELILSKDINPGLHEFLNNKKGSEVIVTVPKKGEKKTLLDLVMKNIELSFFGDIEKMASLRDSLGLSGMPYVIECFDISHLSGTNTVASMVQFRNAKPDKSNYRRFRIRTVEGIDDFKSIAEVVRRRYSRLKKENSQFPDLIVIDGGIGQLGMAKSELDALNLDIPLISLAKREEEIFFPDGHSVLLPRKEKSLQLVQAIRDEAHRFAITYNRLLRKKSLLG